MSPPINNWQRRAEHRFYAEIVTHITTWNSERRHITGQHKKLQRWATRTGGSSSAREGKQFLPLIRLPRPVTYKDTIYTATSYMQRHNVYCDPLHTKTIYTATSYIQRHNIYCDQLHTKTIYTATSYIQRHNIHCDQLPRS
jgi:hypothetical protein